MDLLSSFVFWDFAFRNHYILRLLHWKFCPLKILGLEIMYKEMSYNGDHKLEILALKKNLFDLKPKPLAGKVKEI